MKRENAYQIRLIKILEMLCRDSDESKTIDTTEILEYLEKEGIACDRKTLYKDIDTLNAFGYEVLCDRSPGRSNRYYVADRRFDIPELRILMDAVQASSLITPKKTEELVDKIASLGGSNRAELLKSNIVAFNTTKSTNENVFYAVSEITSAIEQGKKVSFEYFDYDANHQRVYRRNRKRYYVNPLATVFADDNYYLICYYGRFEGVVHYRVDRMDHVEMVVDQLIDPYRGEPVDVSRHKRQLFGMFQGEEQQVEFYADKCLLDPLFDKFGETLVLKQVDETHVHFSAEVQVSPVFFGWCCSFGNKLRVTAPDDVVQRLVTHMQSVMQGYRE